VSAAKTALQVREAAGRRARDEALMLDRLVGTMRLASFRSYLLATVETMSALVPDVLGMAGSDVPSALQHIRPGHRWPMITNLGAEDGRSGRAFNRREKGAGKFVTRPAPLFGDAVIAEGALGDWVEARIAGGSLDVTLRSESFELSTADGTGYIRIAATLPDTVLAACIGRPLADVVDHPLLRAHAYVIDHVAQVGRASSLAFKVGRLGLEMPWRE
jgi:hypothetical protein